MRSAFPMSNDFSVEWRQDAHTIPEGILVATDEKQEWMLPWWWEQYSQFNRHPVAFVDFGMTENAKQWCQERGILIPIPFALSLTKEQTPQGVAAKWESCFGTAFWPSRPMWLIKPLAMMQTPFQNTLWLDLDTEILGSLAPLFSKEQELAMALEPEYSQKQEIVHGLIHEDEQYFNAGVVLYKANSSAISLWAREAIRQAPLFWSDQHVASRLHYQNKLFIAQIPMIYNWRFVLGKNPEAVIVHWVGDMGKEFIRFRAQRLI